MHFELCVFEQLLILGVELVLQPVQIADGERQHQRILNTLHSELPDKFSGSCVVEVQHLLQTGPSQNSGE